MTGGGWGSYSYIHLPTYGGPQVTTFTQTSSHHTDTTPTHNRLKLVWCGCGVGVVRAGLGEGCHLWATVHRLQQAGMTHECRILAAVYMPLLPAN